MQTVGLVCVDEQTQVTLSSCSQRRRAAEGSQISIFLLPKTPRRGGIANQSVDVAYSIPAMTMGRADRLVTRCESSSRRLINWRSQSPRRGPRISQRRGLAPRLAEGPATPIPIQDATPTGGSLHDRPYLDSATGPAVNNSAGADRHLANAAFKRTNFKGNRVKRPLVERPRLVLD
jgi:hypothetical protein